MIEHFKKIGQTVLERNNYYTIKDTYEQRRAFLLPLTILPVVRKDGITRAICLDLDLEKRQYTFKLDRELIDENREYFFGLRVGTPNDKKKFLCTNNYKGLLDKTFSDILSFLSDKRAASESQAWFAENVSTKYDRLIQDIEDSFSRFDGTCLEPEQKIYYDRIAQDETKPEKIYEKLLLQLFPEAKKSDQLPSLYLVTINGRHILEHPDPDIRSAYLAVAYYDLYLRYTLEGIHSDKYCHACGTGGDVAGKLPLPMKFYGTTNRLNFENTKNQNAYKSFGLCPKCMGDILVGMKYTEFQLQNYLFHMTCYLVPGLPTGGAEFENQLKKMARLLDKREGMYHDDIKSIKEWVNASVKRRAPLRFSLLFFHSEKAEFNILRYISDIELRELMGKMELFDQMTERYQLHTIGKNDNSFRLIDIRYALFPSKGSHAKADFTIYGKALLSFLDNFLSDRPLSYRDMIGRFTSIYRRRFLKKDGYSDIFSPMKMVCFLTILKERNLLKEETGMNQFQPNTEILKQEYRDFFATHAGVYETNFHRQGLFLLGTVISRIAYEQKRKGEGRKDSSTFLAKLNYDGIMPRRVPKLVGEVKKFAVIYSIYQEPELWGTITDRLQGIESSPLKPDEVVFYILTGISFESYLGMKKGNEYRMNKLHEGEDNGEQ